MTEAKHTELKLPLAVDTDARAGMAWNNHIVDAAGNRICFMAHDGTEENLLGEAWVALIVKAVNNHQALVDALEWYGEQARLCRLIHSGGDGGRQNLANDGGKRAEAVLKAVQS